MGLFSKKKPAANTAVNTVKKTAAVNADDIWNTPVRKKQEEVTLKESKYGQPVTEKVDVESIEPETIRNKMAQLEKELEEKKNKPVKTFADFDHNDVDDEEIKDAQTEYEKLYQVEHERFVKSHYEDITVASESGVDEKVAAMLKEHEDRVKADERDFGFNKVDPDEVNRKLEDLPYAKKPEDYPEYKDIKSADSVDESEIEKLGRIDHSEDPDNIGSVSDELLAQKVREFEEKYGG